MKKSSSTLALVGVRNSRRAMARSDDRVGDNLLGRGGGLWRARAMALATIALPLSMPAGADDFRNRVAGPEPTVPVGRSFGDEPQQDTEPPRILVCSGEFVVGQIVELRTEAPDGNLGLPAGAVGRVLSADGTALLVEFGGFSGGHDGRGWARTPVIANNGSNRWWVRCDDVVDQPDPQPMQDGASVVVADFLSGPTDAGAGTSYTAALAEMGVSSTPLANLANLGPYDIVFVLHQNNGSTLTLGSAAATLAAWVNGGGVLVAHDRNVASAHSWVPGLTQATRTAGTTCDLGPQAASTVQGSFGQLTNASLDGGTYSLHGYFATTPPASLVGLLWPSPQSPAAFAYRFGLGWVYYSTLPLDYYLAGTGGATMNANARVYAKNVAQRMIERANPDIDGDGVPNESDACPDQAGPASCSGCPLNICGTCGTPVNTDGDSLADCVDPDDDNDGVADGSDNCSLVANPSQTDCNGNGIGEACETYPDCDADGVPDSCEIAEGYSTDCNGDSIPDSCQGGAALTPVAQTTDNLGAPSGEDPRTFTFTDLPYAATPVSIGLDVRGDLDGATEWVDVALNGGPARRFFAADGHDCAVAADHATISLTNDELNAVMGTTRELTVTLSCPETVDATECKANGLTRFSLTYSGFDGSAGDCNGNHELDFCEIVAGATPDCNGNHVPDSCDLASGSAPDCNSNGVPDSCDLATGSAVDCNTNAIPDSCDIASGTSLDIDGNSRPDECQTVTVTAGGSIQIAIDSAPAGEMRIITLAGGSYSGPIDFGGRSIVLRGAGAAVTIITGVAGATTSVVRMAYEPAIAAIEGVTIRGGETGSPHPENPKANVGGGIFMFHSAASMRDCIVEENRSGFGGGGYFAFSTGSIERCVFRNNYAATDGGGFELYDGAPRVVDSSVEGNWCSEGRGGGVHIHMGTATLMDTTIRLNGCGSISGGLSWVPDGQAAAFLTLDGCTISDNTAGVVWGGIGIIPDDGPTKISLAGSAACGNSPLPNIAGAWIDLGDNSICDCVSDINHDGLTNGVDLAQVLADWGTCGVCPGDLDGDGAVDGNDLAMILAGWGECGDRAWPPPLAWATTIEAFVDPAVVTDPALAQRIAETGLPWRVRDNASNIEMLLVPAGTFMMGCSPSQTYACQSNENPVHQVTLTSAFYLGRTEVTQAQWQAEMGSNPSWFVGYADSPSRPVEQAPWNTIQVFLSQNGLRLPTEAEWEYAYRAGTTTAFHSMPGYPSGTNADSQLTNIAWYSSNSGSQSHAVANKTANALGLYDISGNVYEWCQDWVGVYPSGGVTNPMGPSTGTNRQARGGGFNGSSNWSRASTRTWGTPTGVFYNAGFRVARSP